MAVQAVTHDGLERILNATDSLVHGVGPVRGMKLLPVTLLTGMVAAVLAIAERVFATLTAESFAFEWLAFWALSVVAVMLLAKTAFGLSHWLVRSEHGLVARWKRSRAAEEVMRVASSDFRMMADLRVARAHAEALLG